MQKPPLDPDVADAAPTSMTLTVASSISSRTNAKAWCDLLPPLSARGPNLSPSLLRRAVSLGHDMSPHCRRGFLRRLYRPDSQHLLPFSPVDWHDSAGRAIAVSSKMSLTSDGPCSLLTAKPRGHLLLQGSIASSRIANRVRSAGGAVRRHDVDGRSWCLLTVSLGSPTTSSIWHV